MYLIEFEHLKAFLLGGKADFVLINKTNQHHLNYKILFRSEVDNKKTYFVFFVSTKDIYIGNITIYDNKLDGYFYENKKTGGQYIKPLKIFVGLFYFIFRKNQLPNNVEIGYSGVCFVCNRKLTDPKYIAMGIGQKCLEKNELNHN